MGREWAWNGWASDPLPSACAHSGVARFISVCSVVLLHCDDPAGLCQARLIFIKELSCQKQSNMAAWLLWVQVSLWYWWEHLYLEQNRLGFYLFTLEDSWPCWKPCNSFNIFFFDLFCETCLYQKVVIIDSHNRDADSSKEQLDYCGRSNIMTLNYTQTQQPHETGFLLSYIKTYKARTGSMQKKCFGWWRACLSTLCVHLTLGLGWILEKNIRKKGVISRWERYYFNLPYSVVLSYISCLS